MFRLLLRVGEAARARGSAHGRVDLVGCLKSILEAHGITVLENGESEAGEITRSVDLAQDSQPRDSHGPTQDVRRRVSRRRLSFDDARLDETWLSEHTQSIRELSPPETRKRGLLSQPAHRGRPSSLAPARRARSSSSRRSITLQHSTPKHRQQISPPTAHSLERDEQSYPTLLFQPSQTQLEMNADAFLFTSVIRTARHCLHSWHDAALSRYQFRLQGNAIATAYDRRLILKLAFDTWLEKFCMHREELATNARWQKEDDRARGHYNKTVIGRKLRKWVDSTTDQHYAVYRANVHLLLWKYFRRWRHITTDNTWKVRLILTRKWSAVWRAKVARRRLREEQAAAFREESMMRRGFGAWFWHFCSRRVEGWHEQRVKKRAFEAVKRRLRYNQNGEDRAEDHQNAQIAHRTFQSLLLSLRDRQQQGRTAVTHFERRTIQQCLGKLKVGTELSPIAKKLALKAQLTLERKVFRVWHLQVTLTRQAAEVDRQRILQLTWTSWNDALRHRVLGQRIDERVVVENLYKWVLAERSRLLERRVNARLAKTALAHWRQRLHDGVSKLEIAEAAFEQSRRRRALISSIGQMHLALRRREDAERTALEFANARVLPIVIRSLVDKIRELAQMERWVADARFYSLCTRTLAVWRERTSQQVRVKRKDAYARVRARVKIRVVGACFARWRESCAEIQHWNAEAERLAQDRVFTIGIQAFDRWRERSAQIFEMEEQARILDQQKLLLAALTVVKARAAESTALTRRAMEFHYEIDMALLSSALKKLQWQQFTAVRRSESADALWARNRDQHVRQMLRHWCAQAVARRYAKASAAADEEPESPSLRPASRAASRSRSAQRLAASSPPAATPAYMRTPSRSRRAGRFRPLPTPAPLTPFTFDRSYLTTTPAPLPPPSNLQANQDRHPPFPPDTLLDGTEPVDLDILTPQVTPFARKLRAGGIASTPAPSALRSSIFGRSAVPTGYGGTAKSVRFAGGSRFQGGRSHEKSS